MRQILFKAKRKDNRKWIEGGYSEHDGKVFIVTWVRYVPDTRDWDTAEYYENNPHYNSTLIEVIPETVCQYTGLHDCTKWDQLSEIEQDEFLSEWIYEENRRNTKEDWKGRKIFENDIATIPYSNKQGLPGKIYYSPQDAWFCIRRNGYKPILLKDSNEWCEIIGNIFDERSA